MSPLTVIGLPCCSHGIGVNLDLIEGKEEQSLVALGGPLGGHVGLGWVG